MRVLPFFKKEDCVTYAELLDKAFGDNLPAIESDYEVWMGGPSSMDNIIPELKGHVFKQKYLYSVLDVKLPRVGFKFEDTPAGFIKASLEEAGAISITYWDSAACQESRLLENNYRAQFSDFGTLRFGHRDNWMSIRVNDYVITLLRGSMSRPMPTGVNAGNNGLTQYTFNFAYEDYDVDYIVWKQAVDYSLHDRKYESLILLE